MIQAGPSFGEELRNKLQAYYTPEVSYYSGKVRDVYTIGKKFFVMLTSNRISAFDVILPEPIPEKGAILGIIAARMLKATEDICSNWLIESPLPQLGIGIYCKPFKIEMVVRQTLTGHAWRIYEAGGTEICGVKLPDGLKENCFLPRGPIITPTTKADEGHDEDITREGIVRLGLATAAEVQKLYEYSYALFERGAEIAKRNGLILADTKYEFGVDNDGNITVMDELHTPDSSRYFYEEGFAEQVANGLPVKQLSKEFVREWLIGEGFMGKAGQVPPEMTPEWIAKITERYIELYEKLLGEKYKRRAEEYTVSQLEDIICNAVDGLYELKW
jgi:phosphoribosylaminoimidazole-succinocarboxamide synthase